jgi:hypothetical protein
MFARKWQRVIREQIDLVVMEFPIYRYPSFRVVTEEQDTRSYAASHTTDPIIVIVQNREIIAALIREHTQFRGLVFINIFMPIKVINAKVGENRDIWVKPLDAQ